MNDFKKILPKELNKTAFEMVGTDWMLVTAKKSDGTINTMTASWGGLGVLWNRDVCYVVIRPQRYTREFLDESESFSLTFFPEEYRKELGYLGSVSGRDEDKIAKSGLTADEHDGIPYFKEANTVMFVKKLFAQQMTKEAFAEEGFAEEFYPAEDYHILYIGEIKEVLVK